MHGPNDDQASTVYAGWDKGYIDRKTGSSSDFGDDIAAKLDTINYEVTCIITNRVPRVYKIGKKTSIKKILPNKSSIILAN